MIGNVKVVNCRTNKINCIMEVICLQCTSIPILPYMHSFYQICAMHQFIMFNPIFVLADQIED